MYSLILFSLNGAATGETGNATNRYNFLDIVGRFWENANLVLSRFFFEPASLLA